MNVPSQVSFLQILKLVIIVLWGGGAHAFMLSEPWAHNLTKGRAHYRRRPHVPHACTAGSKMGPPSCGLARPTVNPAVLYVKPALCWPGRYVGCVFGRARTLAMHPHGQVWAGRLGCAEEQPKRLSDGCGACGNF